MHKATIRPHSASRDCLHFPVLTVVVTAAFLISGLCCNAHGIEANTNGSQSLARLESLFSEKGGKCDVPNHSISEPEKWVLDSGDSAVPILRKAMANKDDDERAFCAAYLLALVGTTAARDALRNEYDRTHDTYLKALLCFSMSITGDENDIDFLIASLSGEHYGDEWPPIEAAALSLGVLRARKAVPALRACASAEEGSIASDAAQHALNWITAPIPQGPPSSEASEREQVILAMFQFGIPRVEESDVFYEKDRNQKWILKGTHWTYQKVVSDAAVKGAPTIHFDVYISEKESKALVAVGMTFGPLNGKGYNCILKKHEGRWKVLGILSTWIS